MEFLQGDNTYLWKNALLGQKADQGEAALVGDLVGRVHDASTRAQFDTKASLNRDDFQALCINPNLLYTASIHRDIAASLEQIAAQLYQSNQRMFTSIGFCYVSIEFWYVITGLR